MPDQLVVVTAHAARIPALWRTCWVRLVVDELAKRKITPETVRAAIELADQAIS